MTRTLLLAAAFAATAAAAQTDAVPLTLRKDLVGDKVQVTKTGTESSKFSFAGTEKDEKRGTKFVFTQEILERPADARRPTKLARAYETAERTNAKGEAAKLAYDGKKVLIEKKDKKYTFTVDGEELPPGDAEELDKEFNKRGEKPLGPEDFLPKGPVKVNETWTVDPGMVADSFEADAPMTVDRDKTKVTGKLTKVYKKGAATFGVIEVEMALAAKTMKSAGKDVPLKDGSKFAVRFDMDVCVDGSGSDGTSGLAFKMDLKADLPQGALTIVVDAGGKEVRKQVGKK